MSHLRSSRRWPTAAALVLVLTGTLAAHDMWIEPTSFNADTGALLGLRLRVGQDFLGDPLVRDAALIDRFVVAGPNGIRRVVGREGGDPAGLLRPTDQGLLVAGYQSHPSHVALSAAKFRQYLADEGLDRIAALRASRGEADANATEIFTRCARTLVLLGAPDAAQRDQPLHFILELVAERNPYAMRAGQDVPFRLTYNGEPLAHALIVAINQREPQARISARSDADGRVRLTLDKPGAWLIKAVHMTPAPAGSDSQWASYWASLTFDLPAAARASR